MLRYFSLALSFFVLTSQSSLLAQAQKPKEPAWTHAFDLSYRKLGEAEFKDDQKFGVEVFKDTNTNLGVYISQTGSLGLTAGFAGLTAPITKGKGPAWIAGLDMPARKFGVPEFDKATTVHAMEAFHDANVGAWIYVTEKANLGVTAGAKSPSPGGLKGPKWMHSMDLRCRKGGIREWKDALKFGVEVYKDNNTNNLIYICSETGAIAAIPDSGTVPAGKSRDPDWLHGLDLKCRKHNEPDFGAKTRKLGVEVFRDGHNGNLIYLTDAGTLAVVAGPKEVKAPSVNVKEPAWTHGLNLKCRKFGEKSFSDKTQVFGCEIFRDDNTGVVLYIAETGSIAIAKKD